MSLKAALETLGFAPLLPHDRGLRAPGARWVLGGRVAGRAGRLGRLSRELRGGRGLAGLHVLRRAAPEAPGRQGAPERAGPQAVVREHARHRLPDKQDHRRLPALPRGLRVRRPLRPRGLRDRPDGQRDHLAGHLRRPLRGTLRRDSGLCATQRGGQKGCKSPRAPSRAGTATRTPPRTPTQCTEVARQRIEDLPRFPSVRAASP